MSCLLIQPTFKPGDLPPAGYLAWHEWAEVQRKAGIRQKQCRCCGRWFTPQEKHTAATCEARPDRSQSGGGA